MMLQTYHRKLVLPSVLFTDAGTGVVNVQIYSDMTGWLRIQVFKQLEACFKICDGPSFVQVSDVRRENSVIIDDSAEGVFQ
jgi:hypothetical protein